MQTYYESVAKPAGPLSPTAGVLVSLTNQSMVPAIAHHACALY